MYKYKVETEKLATQVKKLSNNKTIKEPNQINYDKIKYEKVTTEKKDLKVN